MRWLKRFWWLFLLGLMAGGVLTYRWSASARDLKRSSYTVKKQDLIETLSLSGEVDAKEKADIKFQTSGLLNWVGVKEGDQVKKYQAIASLDKRELQNSLNQYMNSYMKERWDFEQGVDDNKNWQTRGMTSEARDAIKRTLEQNQFDLNNAVLAYEAKNLTYKFATIYAPFEGIITNVDVPLPGTNITPTTATFSLVNPKTMFFSATADQTEIPSFQTGMIGKIVLDSFPDKEIEGNIEIIGFVPKEGESGTVYELKIIFDQDLLNSGIKMGMTGDVSFVLKEIKAVLAVPEAFIEKQDDENFVFRLIKGERVKTKVILGETIEGMTEIKEGLNENDVIYNQP